MNERLSFGQRPALYLGLALSSCASVALSIVLTRLYSAVLGHHLAFFAIALALFGVGLGGTLVTLFARLVPPRRLFARLALLAGVASLGTTVTLIQTLRTVVPHALDADSLRGVALLYALSAVPFTCLGALTAAGLRAARHDAARVYLVDMLGAALGGLVALVLLRLGAPRAGLALAIVFAIAGVVFALGSRARGPYAPEEQPGGGWTAAAFLAGAVVLLFGDYGEQWLTVSKIRDANLDRAQFVAWNELALVTVDRPTRGMAWMRMDASAATAVLAESNDPTRHPEAMGYVLSGPLGPTLVIGAGGGKDVRVALDAGQTKVVAVELNRAIANDVMRGKLKDYAGAIYDRPEVELVVDEGRSFVRADARSYRNIVLSLVDTWAAASVGGLSLSENNLYTVEAFADYLARLDDGGTLVVTRWDEEFPRLLALGAAGLYKAGASAPGDHMFACSHTRTTALLIAKRPLGEEALKKLRRHCQKNRFSEVFAPDKRGALEASVVADPYATARSLTSPKLDPPTDDSPFFFYGRHARELPSLLSDSSKLASEEQGLLTLFLAIGVSLVGALSAFALPLLLRPGALLAKRDRPERLRVLAYFSAIGLGYILVELGLTQILTSLLGHPVYALSVVLTALFAATGLGAFAMRDVRALHAQRAGVPRLAILVVLLTAAALGLGAASASLGGLSLPVRVAFAVIVVGALGLLMGCALPLGVAVGATRSPNLVSWGFAINGFFGVLGASLGTLAAMHIGFSYVLLLGATAYFVAMMTLPRAAYVPETREAARPLATEETAQ